MVEEKKTAIWNGGLDALLASDAPAAGPPVEAVPAVALSSEPSDRSGTRIMGSWLAPVVEEAAKKLNEGREPITRVLPIEDLYPAVAAAERATDATRKEHDATRKEHAPTTEVIALPKVEVPRAQTKEPPALLGKLRALATGPERERFFLYGGLGAFLLIMGLLMGVRAITMGAGEPPQVAVAQVAPAGPTRSKTAANVAPVPATSDAPARTLGVVPSGLERAAVDALARGDYVQAQRMYADLAKAQPFRTEFHEAARILARAADESGGIRTGH